MKIENTITQAESQIDQVMEHLAQQCLPAISEIVKKSPDDWNDMDKEGIGNALSWLEFILLTRELKRRIEGDGNG